MTIIRRAVGARVAFVPTVDVAVDVASFLFVFIVFFFFEFFSFSFQNLAAGTASCHLDARLLWPAAGVGPASREIQASSADAARVTSVAGARAVTLRKAQRPARF